MKVRQPKRDTHPPCHQRCDKEENRNHKQNPRD
jgi:hypothetical protein